MNRIAVMEARRFSLVLSLLALAIAGGCRGAADTVPRTIGSLEGVQDPSSMAVEGNDLFVVDENRFVRVYSIEPFAFRFMIGGKGEGPRELQNLPSLWTTADSIAVSDFMKTLWFSRTGQFVKAIVYSDFPDFDPRQLTLLFPAGGRYLRTVNHHSDRRRTVTLFDGGLRRITTLYEGLFDWNQTGGPNGFNPLSHRIEVVTGDDEIYVSDTEKGFFIKVFALDGQALATIDLTKAEEAVPVSRADHDRLLAEIRQTRAENVYLFAQANARFPETFPRIHHLRYSDGRLYVTTHREMDGLHELLVLDTRGKVLDRLFLPIPSFHHFRGAVRNDLFAVSGGGLYELVRIPETKGWEVVRTDLTKRSLFR